MSSSAQRGGFPVSASLFAEGSGLASGLVTPVQETSGRRRRRRPLPLLRLTRSARQRPRHDVVTGRRRWRGRPQVVLPALAVQPCRRVRGVPCFPEGMVLGPVLVNRQDDLVGK